GQPLQLVQHPMAVPPPWGAFYSPPPAYHQGFPEGYPAGYPPGYPPPSQPDGPSMNPGLCKVEGVTHLPKNLVPEFLSPSTCTTMHQSPGDLTSMGPPLPDHTSTEASAERVVVLSSYLLMYPRQWRLISGLMNELTDLRDEEEGVVGELLQSVSTVYPI
ncbi:hypothetical protein Hamer_G026873, partial [Homarus americanus]